jgi:signal transduction histidine kinase
VQLTQPQARRSDARRPIWLPGALLCAADIALVAAAFRLAALNGYPFGGLLFLLSEPLAMLVGGLIVARQPRNPVGWLIIGHALCFTLGELCRQYALYGGVTAPGALPFAAAVAWPAYWLWGPAIAMGFALLPLYFPSGRLPSPGWRFAPWLIVIAMGAATGTMALQPGDDETPGLPNPLGLLPPLDQQGPLGSLFGVAWVLSALLGLLSLADRFRRAGSDERKQIQWLAFAVLVLVVGDRLFPTSGPLSEVMLLLCLTGIWVAIGVAVLRYRLYDIDIIINRTLVYGALSAIVAGLYVALVAYLGALFNTGSNLMIALATTGVVAVIFQPLRERLQRGVNRLLYGARDEPYSVLALLGRRLEATLAPPEALDTIVATLAQTLKLPYVAIALGPDQEPVALAAQPGDASRRGALLTLPLSYHGEPAGELRVAPRAGEAGLSPADQRLLDDLARQIGVAVSAARLTAELQQARERLVTAREEERRRLRRDLHDGLGPALAAQTLKVGSARHFLTRDSATADRLLGELERDIAAALQEVRRLVYDLRPPALDDLGLVGALRLLAAQYSGEVAGPQVAVEAPELPPLPAAVEVAAYRIAQEALANAVRHGRAGRCAVRLEVTDGRAGQPRLALEVADDGRGIAPEARGGVGLHSMRERAAELGGSCSVSPRPGGGTLVRAELPLTYGAST